MSEKKYNKSEALEIALKNAKEAKKEGRFYSQRFDLIEGCLLEVMHCRDGKGGKVLGEWRYTTDYGQTFWQMMVD
jgi:hypothetical protein